jgi:hypothetical protein
MVWFEFKDATGEDAEGVPAAAQIGTEESETAPAVVTIRKRKFEIIEYEDPDDLLGE